MQVIVESLHHTRVGVFTLFQTKDEAPSGRDNAHKREPRIVTFHSRRDAYILHLPTSLVCVRYPFYYRSACFIIYLCSYTWHRVRSSTLRANMRYDRYRNVNESALIISRLSYSACIVDESHANRHTSARSLRRDRYAALDWWLDAFGITACVSSGSWISLARFKTVTLLNPKSHWTGSTFVVCHVFWTDL